MNINIVKHEINTGFHDRIKHLDYEFKKADNLFVFVTTEYEYIFKLIYTKWSGYISISIFAFINHRKIERILTKIINEKRYSYTLGSEIKKITDSPDGRIDPLQTLTLIVDNNFSPANAIEVIERSFFDVAIPFFERYSNLDKIDFLYNSSAFDSFLIYGTWADRCMKGLVIAKLVGRKDYHELVSLFDILILRMESKSEYWQYESVKNHLSTTAIHLK